MNQKLKVAILGSGNIGADLLIKILRSPSLECTLFIGRNPDSSGLARARALGVPVSADGIQAILRNPDCCEVVFDATSAGEHLKHWPLLRALGKRVVDLTPSRVGTMVVPAINAHAFHDADNINMISCGGQASTPLAYAIAQTQPGIEYFEVVSSIASLSAGPATRANIDEYIDTTETAIRHFTGCAATKAILILNPAQPSIHMQTTVSAKVATADLDRLRPVIDRMVASIQHYVPGYQMVVPPVFEHNRIVVMVRVTGRGDFLPTYAGNLDIINCAAIAATEQFARGRRTVAA
ncbi:MAG: acetaldehyde dehydrogenase (acetylating) [Opitutae bacterium]|nr:acetaldehyde dehydrogenase (acetylating) [Opitutae bacterium]